ncbi:hypothetical protein [Anaerosacchariphilus polymeriproducens]|uniref:ABC transporter permease n=1 Tax=Anaerosacchariphilus polymeriproducens TaxID=1812858 RepID=A0A371AXY1_9FIRM|nr:hypothetical protein [Anaerosacchariphilus polymeriproducens]RDU24423.1 hypothetical protein DWV06_02795 [Anaerosacchariphilus polymeriproducens]
MKKLWNVLSVDLEYGIFSVRFFLAVIGTALVILLGGSQMLFLSKDQLKQGIEAGYHFKVVLEGVGAESFVFAIPILSTIAFGTRFLEEQGHGYLKHYLPRCNRKNYIFSKVTSTAFGSGLSVFLGTWLSAGILFLALSPLELTKAKGAENFLWQVSKISFLAFALGMLWGTIGACCAIGFHNRYMAYGGPFLISYLSIILFTRYFSGIYVINPREWVSRQHDWGDTILSILGILVELSVIAVMVYATLLKRDIDCE